MICVTVKTEKNMLREFKAEGHAGYNPGNDIVCAGVSALVFTLLDVFEKIKGVSISIKSGYVKILVFSKIPDEYEIAFRVVYSGLKKIESTYGDYVQIIETKESELGEVFDY